MNPSATHHESKPRTDAQRTVIIFLALTIAFCLIPYSLILSADSINAIPDLAIVGIMWAPGLAALTTRLFVQRNLRNFGWRPGAPRYLVISYLLPAVGCLLVYGFVWTTGLGGFSAARVARDGTFARNVFEAVTAGFLMEAVLAFGEELGWRGLLVPELAKFVSFGRTALISGSIWVVVHVPGILFAGYHSAAPIWFGLVMFTVSFIAISVILAWLRLTSGSVWTAVVFHASHNLFVQDLFDRMTVSRDATEYVTTEFGVGLALFYAVVATLYWRRRSELPTAHQRTSRSSTSAVPRFDRSSSAVLIWRR